MTEKIPIRTLLSLSTALVSISTALAGPPPPPDKSTGITFSTNGQTTTGKQTVTNGVGVWNKAVDIGAGSKLAIEAAPNLTGAKTVIRAPSITIGGALTFTNTKGIVVVDGKYLVLPGGTVIANSGLTVVAGAAASKVDLEAFSKTGQLNLTPVVGNGSSYANFSGATQLKGGISIDANGVVTDKNSQVTARAVDVNTATLAWAGLIDLGQSEKVSISADNLGFTTAQGPDLRSFKAVADKYRQDPGAAERLALKVRQGGNGAWGVVYMPANAQVTPEESKRLVAWVRGLK